MNVKQVTACSQMPYAEETSARDKPTTLFALLPSSGSSECLFLVSNVERITMDRLKKTSPFVHKTRWHLWKKIKDVLYIILL